MDDHAFIDHTFPSTPSNFTDFRHATPWLPVEDDILFSFSPSPLRLPWDTTTTSHFFTDEPFTPIPDLPHPYTPLPSPSPSLLDGLCNSVSFQFHKGLEHGSKFLPQLPSSTSPKKNKGDCHVDENKEQEEESLSDMFYRFFLNHHVHKILHARGKKTDKKTKQLQAGSRGRKRNFSSGNREVVDHISMLAVCGQAIVTGDNRKAKETLKQVREHSSPFGDASERLSHYFADAIEARLAGTGAQLDAVMARRSPSATEMLRIYGDFLPSCPVKVMASYFSMHQLLLLASTAKSIHIIDFGIHYGFHWPLFIQALSTRPGSPPRLRITGLEQQDEKEFGGVLLQASSLLHRFCEEHGVPFEFIGISKSWELVQVGELGLSGEDDVVAVHSQFRLERICDEAREGGGGESPRGAVLSLIKKIGPDVCVQHSICGSFGAAEFWSRFREALHHYSTLFDMLDKSFQGGSSERWKCESVMWARDIMNIVACEGADRTVRPRTYKQWEADAGWLGFRLLPLEGEFVTAMAAAVTAGYHTDYMVENDGGWLLLGWKGRIICSSSCWIPRNNSI